MPELPEVETVRRVLQENLISKRILDIKSNYPKMVEDDFLYFKNTLLNKTFSDITRKGKYLIFHLDDIYLISHLRMEGKFFYVKTNTLFNEHIHMEFLLSNGYSLLYQDVRKFGRMTLKNEEDLYTTLPLSKLALDANDPSFNYFDLYNVLQSKKKSIKESLLDQSVIAGLGNIYVDEVLFKCSLFPLLPSKNVTLNDAKNILLYSQEVLNQAIKNKGTTIRSYTSSLNVIGNYQNFLNVHTKDICMICNTKIEKIKVGGRGTYYCPLCQKYE